MNTAELAFVLPDPQTASAVHAALLPECAEGPEGSEVELRLDDATITAGVRATDVSTLRAAINSVVRLLDAAHRTVAPGKVL